MIESGFGSDREHTGEKESPYHPPKPASGAAFKCGNFARYQARKEMARSKRCSHPYSLLR